MVGTSNAASVVPLAGVALPLEAGDVGTPTGAVALTPIAVAADHDLSATTRAESGRFIPHVHPRQAKGVLDGIVRGCNTGAAPVVDTV